MCGKEAVETEGCLLPLTTNDWASTNKVIYDRSELALTMRLDCCFVFLLLYCDGFCNGVSIEMIEIGSIDGGETIGYDIL